MTLQEKLNNRWKRRREIAQTSDRVRKSGEIILSNVKINKNGLVPKSEVRGADK